MPGNGKTQCGKDISVCKNKNIAGERHSRYASFYLLNFFKLIHIQSFGLFAAISIVAAGVVTCSLKMNIMWSFPMANTIVWLHYEEIIGKPIVPIWYSYIYFCIAVIILVLLNIIAVKRFQFTNIEQVE